MKYNQDLEALATQLEGAGFVMVGDTVSGKVHSPNIDQETLDALRADYETLRRFVVSLVEQPVLVNAVVTDLAIQALQACSAVYLPPGHPDRSH